MGTGGGALTGTQEADYLDERRVLGHTDSTDCTDFSISNTDYTNLHGLFHTDALLAIT